jgi:hypothetical protein
MLRMHSRKPEELFDRHEFVRLQNCFAVESTGDQGATVAACPP